MIISFKLPGNMVFLCLSGISPSLVYVALPAGTLGVEATIEPVPGSLLEPFALLLTGKDSMVELICAVATVPSVPVYLARSGFSI